MKTEPYVCECGSTIFVRYTGDKRIYCKRCRKPVPENVVFKDEFGQGKPDQHVL